MLLRRPLVGLALLGLVSGAGCASSVNEPVPSQTTTQFVVTVPVTPASGSTLNHRNFQVPSGTQSITIVLTSVNGTATTSTTRTFNVTGDSSGCAERGTVIQCTEFVASVPGTDVFTITAYSQPGAQGDVVAKGQSQVDTTSGQTVVAPVAITGTAAKISVSLASLPLGVTGGQTVAIPVSVIAKDSSGATIMGSYSNPITLTDSDASGATALSQTTISNSTDTVTLSYNGAALSSPATISASASNVSGDNVTPATFSPNADYATIPGQALSYAESTNFTETYPSGSPYYASMNATRVDTFSNGASFDGQQNLIEVSDAYNDSTMGPSDSNTTNSYYAWANTASGADLHELGNEYVLTSSGALQEDSINTYAGSGALVTRVPFSAGNSWAYGDTYTQSTTGAVGSNQATFNADGSYDDAVTQPDGTQLHYVLNADSSAALTYTGTDNVTTTATWAAPTTSNGSYGISYTAPGTAAVTISDWYPGNGPAPSPLETDTMTDKGVVSIPASCNVPAAYGTQAELLEEHLTQTDVLNGVNETAINDLYYVQGVGLVAAELSYNADTYDTTSGTFLYHDAMTTVDSLTSNASTQLLLRKRNATQTAFGPVTAQLRNGFLAHARALRAARHHK